MFFLNKNIDTLMVFNLVVIKKNFVIFITTYNIKYEI